MATNQFPSTTDEQFTKGRFSGTVAIVTGGASGIGKEISKRFANDGATVIMFGFHSVESGKELEKSLTAAGHQVEYMVCDVSDRDQCIQTVNTVAEKHGKVNFLVNNAGYIAMRDKAENWNKVMSVDVQGCSNMVQACHTHMIKAEEGRRAVVNISAISAYRAQPAMGWAYSASKGAVLTLTKCMALDLAKDGIRVNSVSPGWIIKSDNPRAVKYFHAKSKEIGSYHMLNRFGEATEFAAAVTYLCSHDASFITSTDLPVDGGYLGMSAEGQDRKNL